jgi:hypothetical protein
MHLMSQHPNTKEQNKSTELTKDIKERVKVLLPRALDLAEVYTKKFFDLNISINAIT